MNKFPNKLQKKIEDRIEENTLRSLSLKGNLIDFSSNDYLGFSTSKNIFTSTHDYLMVQNIIRNGATGSRLLSGNHQLYNVVEAILCEFHNSDSALVFNSGYDANVGFFSSVPQRGDIILYDELIHASIRDGIQLSNAKAYSFKHNDLEDLENKMLRHSELVSKSHQGEIYIVTESVFSMDGDSPDLISILHICKNNNVHLIIDEAHAIGVLGSTGCGEVQRLGLENDVFARLVTFGKGLGCHGAAILGSEVLKKYLVNFARSFIYTTALPPHSLATILFAYKELNRTTEIGKLNQSIQFFKSEIKKLNIQNHFIQSNSAIHCCVIQGNEKTKKIAMQLRTKGFDVKPILSPTVPLGEERLRICLHSYNSHQEIKRMLGALATFVNY